MDGDIPGAVVWDCDGDKWIRRDLGWWIASSPPVNQPYTWEELQDAFGPLSMTQPDKGVRDC
jgi:hypothetical protein